jgi:ribose transport system substrate-binding protein
MAYAFYPTDQRVAGFMARIKHYPGIKVVATGYGVGATTETNGISQGETLLQRYPDLAGFFVSWLDPAMGVVSAARSLGRPNIAITSVDLAEENALLIAGCSTLKASATQLPYAEGLAEGDLLVKIMDGESVPPYVVTPTPIATHSTVLSVYQQVYQATAPAGLKTAVVVHCG